MGRSIKNNETIGLIITGISIGWLMRNFDLLNGSGYSSLFQSLSKTRWTLHVGVVLAFLGIVLGMETKKHKVKSVHGVLYFILIFLLGVFFESFF